MKFAFIFLGLLCAELFYFYLANRFNIIDKPNARSSHTQVTLRGGGIIFCISLLAYFFAFGFQYPWFLAGACIISAISFADDVKPQSSLLRITVHLCAMLLLMYQLNFQHFQWYWWLLALVVMIGVINACNFMDGINGITTLYAFTVMGALWWANQTIKVFDANLLYCLALGNLVFAFFNVRKKARCFAGDVGSVSMAYALIFVTAGLIIAAKNPIFILFFALYGVDTVLTILHRLYKKENIFKPHRQHLFQYLANERAWPHLAVSALYAVVQIGISAGVLWLFQKSVLWQTLYALLVLMALAVVYISVKREHIIASIQKLPASGVQA
ncbi:MAG: glycosyltransferase family 4 protein [Bacteroidetes bacterium]|nr:MAG: glycosyltransferase family 4 protein [Bacteroidota bacterium]